MTMIILLAGAFSQTSKSGKSSGYHLLKKVEIGGEGGWDYLTVDESAHRVYISRSNRVLVVDEETGTGLGEIPNTNGVHGIALVPEVGQGFTTNGRDNTATIFDLKTLKVLNTVKTGKNPDALLFDSVSHRVFTFNGASADATAIDVTNGAVVGTIALGGKPESGAADGKGMIYVNLEDKNEVVAFDSRTLAVKAHWALAPGEEPTGMAIDRKNKRLFIGCHNKKLIVMDYEKGTIVTTLPIGGAVDAAAFDPETKMVFSSNGDGTLTVIQEESPDKFSVVENVTTQIGARTMALDLKTHKIFLVTARFGETPAPTPERPRPRPSMIPNSFVLLIFGK